MSHVLLNIDEDVLRGGIDPIDAFPVMFALINGSHFGESLGIDGNGVLTKDSTKTFLIRTNDHVEKMDQARDDEREKPYRAEDYSISEQFDSKRLICCS